MDHLQQKKKWKRRMRKQMGIRRRLRASSDRPRLSIYRSSKHITVQLIDDLQGVTLAHASTTEAGLQAELAGKSKTEKAQVLGGVIAGRCKEAGVEEIAFDRGYYNYHGRVKALADQARESGLKF
jgi:large subunit ribosomal protein L18